MEGIGLGVKLNLKSLNHLIWPSSTSHFQFKAPSFISTATRACRNNINGSLLPAFRFSPLCTLSSQGSEPIIHNNTQNILQVVLVSPQIPGNTGCIARTCAASGVKLHLVEPLGFQIDDTKLKRAGLDYWPYVVVKVHPSWAAFRDYFSLQDGEKRLLAFTKRGTAIHSVIEMIEMKSDSEKRKTARCRKNSPGAEEVSSGGSSPGGVILKKGPWTAAEDAILIEYVNKHGEGNWNNVMKNTGLHRCGKSCRLRWANHLRPELKKGAFTKEEENEIIRLHAQFGNKWARMATLLPGRTDNEIKNFWNTRIKRMQRIGTPLYPTSCQPTNENLQSDDKMSCQNLDGYHSEDKLTNLNQKYLNCSQPLLDIIPSTSLTFPAMNPRKRFREVDSPFSCITNAYASCDQHEGRPAPGQPLWSTPLCDTGSNINQTSSIDVLGSHAFITNGNSSSCEPDSCAMKLELPSLQCSTPQVGSRDVTLPLFPSFESVDPVIQPPLSKPTQLICFSPIRNDMLEAIVDESQKKSNYKSEQQISNPSANVGAGAVSSSQNVCESKQFLYCDPISPLSPSAASDFPEYTPGSGLNSPDEPLSGETISGTNIKREAVDAKKDLSSSLEYIRPDALLDYFCLFAPIGSRKAYSIIDDVGTGPLLVLGDDLSREYKQPGA